jgi:hypothetical protein
MDDLSAKFDKIDRDVNEKLDAERQSAEVAKRGKVAKVRAQEDAVLVARSLAVQIAERVIEPRVKLIVERLQWFDAHLPDAYKAFSEHLKRAGVIQGIVEYKGRD